MQGYSTSMSRPKITLVGAGSTVFAKNIIGDVLSFPELADCVVSLYDIDEERLATSKIVARKLASSVNAPATIEATIDHRRARDSRQHRLGTRAIDRVCARAGPR